MGQKVNPNGMRVGINREWESKWYANSKDFATYLHEDIKIRKTVEKSLSTPENDALVSHIEIERVKGTVVVFIHCVRTGVVLGQEGKNIAELNKKLIGSAQRVPVPTGSTTILVAVVKGDDVTVDAINAAMKAASSASFGYTEEPLVSSDIIGITYGSLFDATQTMVTKISEGLYQVQVVAWYDNENSYTCQFVRLAKAFAEKN